MILNTQYYCTHTILSKFETTTVEMEFFSDRNFAASWFSLPEMYTLIIILMKLYIVYSYMLSHFFYKVVIHSSAPWLLCDYVAIAVIAHTFCSDC